jgi:hypothetical protein
MRGGPCSERGGRGRDAMLSTKLAFLLQATFFVLCAKWFDTHDDMVASCLLDHTGDEFCGDGSSRLVLLVLTSVREVRDNGGDSTSGSNLAGVNEDKELHETVEEEVRGCSVWFLCPRELQGARKAW